MASIIGQGLLARGDDWAREDSGDHFLDISCTHHLHTQRGCYPAPGMGTKPTQFGLFHQSHLNDYTAEHRHGDVGPKTIPHHHAAGARHGRLPATRRLLVMEKQPIPPPQSGPSPAPAAWMDLLHLIFSASLADPRLWQPCSGVLKEMPDVLACIRRRGPTPCW